MRNLKKFLALVLAMVMAFSLMLSASAMEYKDYPDKDNITEEFQEAVQVLTGLQVFQGDDDGFRPGDTITRAEVATIIYRLATGDVEGKQVNVYADYGNFADVAPTDWFAGAVGYCANAEYIKGDNGYFNPYDSVTGYQALAMILRAVGYDQNHEFEGAAWQTRVASLSKDLGITENVKNASFESTLSMAARRDVVADLLFQTAVTVPTVTYTPALQYSDKISLSSSYKNPTLGQKTFGLFVDDGWSVVDGWGTPGYYWAKGGTHERLYTGTSTYTLKYDANFMPIYSAEVVTDSSKSSYNVVATITPKASAEYNSANIRECDVAHDLDISKSETFRLYVNSKDVTAANYNIQAIDTVTPVGGQGRETKFWHDLESKWFAGKINVCTMVDTYLAKVTGVSAPVLDKAGHVIVKAKLNLDVYDATMSSAAYPNGVGTNNPLDSTDTDGDGKFPSKHVATQDKAFEWAVGDMLLVKGYTDYSQYYDNQGNKTDYTTGNTTGLDHTINAIDIEKTAYETNVLKASDDDAKIKVVGKADMKLGKQTKTYWNVDKHNVDGTDYNDQMTLFLDRAKTDTNVTWAWYFDTLGNLIGIDEAPTTTQYGVITSIYSAFNQGDSYTDGTTKAIASVLMADGTTQTITIDRFLVAAQDGAEGRVDLTDDGEGKKLEDKTGEEKNTDNTSAELIPVYDYESGGANVMKSERLTGKTAYNAIQKKNLFVAPVASVNELKDSAWTSSDSNDYFGIVRGNMYKFVNTQYGMTAVEVAGKYAASHNDENTGIYEWLYHDKADATAKLTKTLGILTVNDAPKTIHVSNSTKIMVRSSDDSKVINVYDGLNNLPGDVTIPANSEVDWVDFNGDGRVDYVYLTGRVSGNITYGLFYFNGGTAVWDGVNKTGTLSGWLNGEETTVTFKDQAQYDLIKNHTSTVDSLNYRAHLFALQMMNGVVSNVMATDDGDDYQYLLANAANAPETTNAKNEIAKFTEDGTDSTTTSEIVTSNDAAETFGLGGVSSKWGNPYDTDTGLVYLQDEDDKADVTYKPGTSTVEHDGGDTYYLAETSKIFGIGRGVAYGENVLYYLNECDKNDVTIVFDESITGYKVILEIYVATDPDWTPAEVGSGTYIGSDVTKAPTGMNKAQLLAWLKNFNGGVFWCDYEKATTSAAGTDNLIYFPFVAGGTSVTLTIRDDSGIRWSENHDSLTDGNAYVLDFDFLNAPASAGSWLGGKGLSAGTYTYNIDSGTTHLTGTFTLIAK